MLAKALDQPRVGFVGLSTSANEGGAKALIDLVRAKVAAVDVPWISESKSGEYLPVKIQSTKVTVSPKKSSR